MLVDLNQHSVKVYSTLRDNASEKSAENMDKLKAYSQDYERFSSSIRIWDRITETMLTTIEPKRAAPKFLTE